MFFWVGWIFSIGTELPFVWVFVFENTVHSCNFSKKNKFQWLGILFPPFRSFFKSYCTETIFEISLLTPFCILRNRMSRKTPINATSDVHGKFQICSPQWTLDGVFPPDVSVEIFETLIWCDSFIFPELTLWNWRKQLLTRLAFIFFVAGDSRGSTPVSLWRVLKKSAGYHRHILRLPILVKMTF